MNVKAECPCGARFESDDARGYYINSGGVPDEKGRIFQVEVVLERWMENHKGCPDAIRVGKILGNA